jgi:hypothetical protein
MTPGEAKAALTWHPLRPELARALTDARLQLHHAAQLATAMGISYLPHAGDDSHTNLGWVEAIGALASHTVDATPPVRLAVRPHPFALLLLEGDEPRATYALDGRRINETADWVRQQLSLRGLDATVYTLEKHYTIPAHAVDDGAAFNASDAAAFEQLSAWYSDASRVLETVVATTPNSSPVRCWPHHFDIATLIEVPPKTAASAQKTIGVGMEPGDIYYAEPYYYVNMYPSPVAAPATELEGGGHWHTHEWIGAVLPGSRVGRGGQSSQIAAFVDSAKAAAERALKTIA